MNDHFNQQKENVLVWSGTVWGHQPIFFCTLRTLRDHAQRFSVASVQLIRHVTLLMSQVLQKLFPGHSQTWLTLVTVGYGVLWLLHRIVEINGCIRRDCRNSSVNVAKGYSRPIRGCGRTTRKRNYLSLVEMEKSRKYFS